jgi:F0F1-type ATP synthase assembly protein I
MVSAVGFVLVTSILIGYAVGHWADARFGIEPIGTAVGVLLGSLAGFIEMLQIVTKASRTQ